MRKTYISAIAALAMIGAAAPVAAETVTIEVNFDDLDLTAEADVDELERRIDVAAREACYSTDSYSVFRQSADRACVEALRQEAALQIAQMRSVA